MPEPDTEAVVAAQAPQTDEFGHELAADGLPINDRLRAEALAAAGKASDPNGRIPDKLIAAAVQRAEGDARDEELATQREADLTRDVLALSKDDLIAFAGRQVPPIAIDASANKPIVQQTVVDELKARANPAPDPMLYDPPAPDVDAGTNTDGAPNGDASKEA